MKQKVLFIINPISGTRHKLKERLPELIEQHLDLEQYDFAIKYTGSKGHAREIAREAVDSNVNIIVIAGGDGSVNEVAAVLKHTETALAIIPLGSGNGLALHLGYPLQVVGCLDIINRGRINNIDLCNYKEMTFCSNAGIGFDAFVTKLYDRSATRGFFSYVKSILLAVAKYPFFKYTLEADGKTMAGRAFLITAFNANQYGYNFKMAPAADIQDGLMDIFILNKFPKWKAPIIMIKVLAGRQIDTAHGTFVKASKVNISTSKPIHFQIDGEPLMKTKEVEINIIPGALKVLVP